MWLDKDMRVATEFFSAGEIGKIMSSVSGKTVHVEKVDEKTFETFKGNRLPALEIHAK